LLVVTGFLAVTPNRLDDLRPHIIELVTASRRDPGCLLYAWAEDFLEPGGIRMIEHWESRAHFEAHDMSSHAEKWKATLAGVELLRREMWSHEATISRCL
jgi:quinol monooxygenase YgiN